MQQFWYIALLYQIHNVIDKQNYNRIMSNSVVKKSPKLREYQNNQQQAQKATQKLAQILINVEQKLISDIQSQSITIPVNTKPLLANIEHQKDINQKQQLKKLNKIRQQKQVIKKKLLQIQCNEKLVQSILNYNNMKLKNICKQRPRSQLSIHDIQKFKILKNQQSKYQQYLNDKTKIFLLEQQQIKQQEQYLCNQSKNLCKNKKRQQIAKRLQQLSMRQKQRLKTFEEGKKQFKKIKYHRRLYQQLQLKWQKIQKQNQQKKLQQYQKIQKQKYIDMQQIKLHQKKYQEIIKKYKQQHQQKYLLLHKIDQRIFKSNKPHRSRFYKFVQQQQLKKKICEKQKKQAMVTLLQKRKQFVQSVKLHHAPKIKQRQQLKQQQNSNSQPKKIPLDKQQSMKRGLQYLQQSKSKANKNRCKSVSADQSKMQTLPQKTPKYHDYLSQTRATKNKNQHKLLKTQILSNADVQQNQQKITKINYCSEEQKIQRLKKLSEKLRFDRKNSKADHLIKKIQQKLKMLQKLK